MEASLFPTLICLDLDLFVPRHRSPRQDEKRPLAENKVDIMMMLTYPIGPRGLFYIMSNTLGQQIDHS